MKFFLKLLACVNVAFANLGFSRRHHVHDDLGDHHGNNESHEHRSFHDHFAHALSVMRYYRQQRGQTYLLGWKSNIEFYFSEIKANMDKCFNHLHMREELCLQALFDDDYFWTK